MARQADHDVDLFTELLRSGKFSKSKQTKAEKKSPARIGRSKNIPGKEKSLKSGTKKDK
jgi:hypothetical protein